MKINWTEIKKNHNEGDYFEKELAVWVEKLAQIRSNRIVLEVIEKEINLKLTGQKNPAKSVASLTISPNYELVISNFEPKKKSGLTEAVLKLGYDKVEGKSSQEKLYFTLSIMTQEKREEYIREVRKITEAGKIALRQIRENFRNLAKKEEDFSRDQKRNYENRIDQLKKDFEAKLTAAGEKKVRELRT